MSPLSLVFVLCAGILAPAPGCREHRVPLVVEVLPQGCAAKVQEALAARPEAQGAIVARYGCAARRTGRQLAAPPAGL